ncbi:hypothetical protein [Bacteroides pyogenes]|uniref:Uncharacterized protein n=1 Tax=Bacteroides pyogenes TaxID=310300 RepID=A0A5D3E8G1_9BACE|nr:hypothetical protein [Bacteroides pyogenes]TYK32413.1 hypothetical protein FNJ60_12365 [Bacteroides pyogenes]
MDSLEKIKSMINKPYLYNREEVVIIGYCDCIGDNGDEIEIYLNNGKTLVFNMCDLLLRLERFRPVTANVIVLANERLNAVSSVNPSILKEIRDTVLDQIRSVKENPQSVAQAKQVFQGVNTLINLAKTELDYRRYIDNNLAD